MLMKKLILLIFVVARLFILYSEPMDIFNLDPRGQNPDFDELSIEDQYKSVFLSFKDKTKGIPRPYESIWASKIVSRFGREIIPLINRTLETEELDFEYREPVSRGISLFGYFFSPLIEKELLTEHEIELYGIIINEKIERYILKYRIIDSSVCNGFFI